jgi:predicted DNA-binding protein
MSDVLTIRVPKELKERMRRLDNGWSEEIRAFIEERIRQLELAELIEETTKNPSRPRTRVDSTHLIREDRERSPP